MSSSFIRDVTNSINKIFSSKNNQCKQDFIRRYNKEKNDNTSYYSPLFHTQDYYSEINKHVTVYNKCISKIAQDDKQREPTL